MSQFNSMPPPTPPGGPGGVVAFSPQPPRIPTTSGLAVASLVCALVCCFPLVTPVLAIVFGIISLISISRSAGYKRGTGVAAAGLVIGSLVLLLQGAAVVGFLGVARPLLNGLAGQFESFVLNIEGGRYGEARAMLTPASQKKAGHQAHRELGALLNKDFGAFKSVSFDFMGSVYQHGVNPPAGAGNPFSAIARASGGTGAAAAAVSIPVPIRAEFSKVGLVYGLIMVAPNVSASAGGGQAAASATPLAIESFTLVGPNGPWSFPFPPTQSSTTMTSTGSGTDPDAGDDSDGSDGGP